ncbi:MAG: hypothetical protein NC417_07340 [Candidatus Gastranaerophilales bacterium]|nr:hypothetical protein [Candidatus Gastranaerophilales bacterium]
MNQVKGKGDRKKVEEILILLFLLIYPLRHIEWGLDFWDTGYNYANFQYMGTEHMDPMWLFSTYMTTAVGHFLTLLPFGGTLRGMNFYTGLFASALAVAGYLFCTRKLGISRWITFAGEFVALGMCWCPTASLYNYLTYVFFLLCVIFLYCGLTQEKGWYLYAAGVCLGVNVLVRFSNLPEAVLIVAVWAYGVIEWLEEREGKKVSRKTLNRTLWCMGGYLTGLGLLLGYLHIRYGLDHYVAGIRQLFAMTDDATDYKANSMLTLMLYDYVENLYWVVRILFIVAVGIVIFGAAAWFTDWLARSKKSGKSAETGFRIAGWISTALRVLWCGVAAAMLIWLYKRGFYSLVLYTYGPMRRPGILFLMLTMGIAAVRIFHRGSPKEEKLISGILILVVLVTSIGSNNKTFPSMNNLFVAAPYTFWEAYRFVRYVGDWKWKRIALCSFPVKAILCAFLLLFAVNATLFGLGFSFAESTGMRHVTAEVKNNEVLGGMRMDPERAEWMRGLSAYVKEQDLAGKDVLLYGGIPALSYYLQMPSAFNPWSDLTSYRPEVMRSAMEEMCRDIEADASYRPVVILEDKYACYLEQRELGTVGSGEESNKEGSVKDVEESEVISAIDQSVEEKYGPEVWNAIEADEKWQMIQNFLEEYGYEQTFRNGKVGVWECR